MVLFDYNFELSNFFVLNSLITLKTGIQRFLSPGSRRAPTLKWLLKFGCEKSKKEQRMFEKVQKGYYATMLKKGKKCKTFGGPLVYIVSWFFFTKSHHRYLKVQFDDTEFTHIHISFCLLLYVLGTLDSLVSLMLHSNSRFETETYLEGYQDMEVISPNIAISLPLS